MKTQACLDPELLRTAEVHLRQSDPVMGILIKKHGPCRLATGAFEPFHTLTASIISQQLSAKAADTIEKRVAQLIPRPFQAADVLCVSEETLKRTGLSSRKVTCIRNLAQHIVNQRLSFEELASAHNDAIISALVKLPGIGRWTAEMFLIFGLKRPDILALDDAGLQRATRLLYGTSAKLETIGNQWRPYSSVASWYLWRHLDH